MEQTGPGDSSGGSSGMHALGFAVKSVVVIVVFVLCQVQGNNYNNKKNKNTEEEEAEEEATAIINKRPGSWSLVCCFP
jgi:hypothetical protein